MKSYLALFLSLLMISCQVDAPQITQQTPTPATPSASSSNVQPKSSPKPTQSTVPSPSDSPIDDTKDFDKNVEKDPVSTDTQTQKTTINWKDYNPIIKGKKYTYSYTIKEGTSTLQTETVWEITDVTDKLYNIKKTFNTTSKDSSLGAVNLSVVINADNSPSIIPIISVGGEKVDPNRTVSIFDKTEKVKVPFKELDAVKVVSKATNASGDVTTTNWYAKDIGLIKSLQEAKDGTYTLELKDYK